MYFVARLVLKAGKLSEDHNLAVRRLRHGLRANLGSFPRDFRTGGIFFSIEGLKFAAQVCEHNVSN